jgi:putative membrane protein
MHGDGGWYMGGMWFFWIIVILGVALAAWFLSSTAKKAGTSGDSAEAILKQRYARGEIDRETYDRMLADLRK